jgi:hypothetical protein
MKKLSFILLLLLPFAVFSHTDTLTAGEGMNEKLKNYEFVFFLNHINSKK